MMLCACNQDCDSRKRQAARERERERERGEKFEKADGMDVNRTQSACTHTLTLASSHDGIFSCYFLVVVREMMRPNWVYDFPQYSHARGNNNMINFLSFPHLLLHLLAADLPGMRKPQAIVPPVCVANDFWVRVYIYIYMLWSRN